MKDSSLVGLYNSIIPKIEERNKQKEKVIQEFDKVHPEIRNKVLAYEEMTHLNIIDRTLYLIKIRENFYKKFEDKLGEDPKEKITKFSSSLLLPFASYPKNYTTNELIKEIDEHLIKTIATNLNKIKTFYFLNFDSILEKSKPVLINNYNLFSIAPFLFSFKELIEIIVHDISKYNGLKNKKTCYRDSDDSWQVRKLLKSIFSEIETRTGIDYAKNYSSGIINQAHSKKHFLTYEFFIERIRINDIIGTESIERILNKSVSLDDLLNLKDMLTIHYPTSKTYNTFKFFLLKHLNIQENSFKASMRSFLDIFYEKSDLSSLGLGLTNKNEKLDFINKENLSDFLGLIKLLKQENILNTSADKIARVIKKTTNVEYTENTIAKKYKNSKNNKQIEIDIKSELAKFIY